MQLKKKPNKNINCLFKFKDLQKSDRSTKDID